VESYQPFDQGKLAQLVNAHPCPSSLLSRKIHQSLWVNRWGVIA